MKGGNIDAVFIYKVSKNKLQKMSQYFSPPSTITPPALHQSQSPMPRRRHLQLANTSSQTATCSGWKQLRVCSSAIQEFQHTQRCLEPPRVTLRMCSLYRSDHFLRLSSYTHVLVPDGRFLRNNPFPLYFGSVLQIPSLEQLDCQFSQEQSPCSASQ